MSRVTYNGVTLPYALTRVHQTGPVMDPSRSDEMLIKIRLEAEGLVTYDDALPLVASIPGGTPTAETVLKYIRHRLCQPRQALIYDTEIGPASPATRNSLINIPGGRDHAGGPFPDDAAIDVQITTQGCFWIKFAVETYIRECNQLFTGTEKVDEPLSIRWEESIEFTETFQAVLTRTGTAVISSLSSISIDTVRRSWVTPAIPAGFGRKTARYMMSRDGLRCDFQFVDEQLQFAPPAPATHMQLVQSEETAPTGVGLRTGTISCNVTGALGADPKALQQIAAQVVNFRLGRSAPSRTTGGLIIGATKFATTETRDGVSVVLVRTYKTGVRNTTPTPRGVRGWVAGGAAGATAGAALGGGLPGAVIGGVIGAIAGNFWDVPPTPTTPAGVASSLPNNFEWVGAGTTSRDGYQPWASNSTTAPTGIVGTAADGLGLARAVKFFAALLRDPCGNVVETTPFAEPSTLTPGTGYVGVAPGIPSGAPVFSTAVTVPATRTSPTAAIGFIAPGAGGSVPASGSGGSGALQADATAAPTTRALLTAAVGAYLSSQVAPDQSFVNPLTAADLAPGLYSLWQCYNEFDTDQGNVVVPTCNPDAPLVQIKHSANVLTFRKKWTACKMGSPPALPAEDQGDNLVLVRKFVGLPNIVITANGTVSEYRIDGVYEYVALNPSAARVVADSPPFLAPTWAAKVYDWADESAPKQLSDDGKTAPYFSTTVQPPAGVYDYPANQYVSSLGTGSTTTNTLSGTPPQPGGSVVSGGAVKGGTSTGAGTIFSIGVGVPGAAGGRSAPNPGTPLFGGASTSSAAPFAASGGAAVVPAPPPQPEPDGGN